MTTPFGDYSPSEKNAYLSVELVTIWNYIVVKIVSDRLLASIVSFISEAKDGGHSVVTTAYFLDVEMDLVTFRLLEIHRITHLVHALKMAIDGFFIHSN